MGKSAKAKNAEMVRQYQEEKRRLEAEEKKKQDRRMWQIIIGVSAVILIAIVVAIALSSRHVPPKMEELDFSTVELENCTDTDKVTDHVRINVTYTDQNGEEKTEDIVIRLFANVAPKTVKNFQDLVKQDFYDGLTFHRVISGFMIQGGDPNGDGTGGSDKDIKGEFSKNGFTNNLSHVRGVVSMARGGEYRDPITGKINYNYDSASSQFFIVHADSTFLDNNYASFGYVVFGMDTVDGIAETEVGYSFGSSDTSPSDPVEPVTINYITFVNVTK